MNKAVTDKLSDIEFKLSELVASSRLKAFSPDCAKQLDLALQLVWDAERVLLIDLEEFNEG